MAASDRIDNSAVACPGLQGTDSDGEINLQKTVILCEKTKGNNHLEFIPVGEFSLNHLPEPYQDKDLLELIKVQADLTVLIVVKRRSEKRPKASDDEQGRMELFEDSEGSSGTASVIRVERNNDNDDCCCETHRTSGRPDNVRGTIYIRTAAHVVWDKFEARNTTCYFFYDDPEEKYQTLKYKICGLEVAVNNGNSDEDRCNLRFVTDNLDLLDMVEKKCQRFDDLRKVVNNNDKKNLYSKGNPGQEPESKLAVIISHPHRLSKQVSVGEWITREEEGDNQLWTQYTYTTPTCPGSSGAPVYLLSRSWLWCDHNHKGVSPLDGLNQSGYGRDNFPRSKPLKRLRESCRQGRDPDVSLEEALPYTLEFARDKNGAKFLRDSLQHATESEKEEVLNQTQPQVLALAKHEHAFVVVETLFHLCNNAQRLTILKEITGNVQEMSLDMYGCSVVVKVLECLQDMTLKVALVKELARRVLAFTDDASGHKVIMSCFQYVDSQHLKVLVDAIIDEVVSLCTNIYGNVVIREILKTKNSEFRAAIIKEITPEVIHLAMDEFGTNVLQCILTDCLDNEKAPVMQKLCENFEGLAKHSQGIHVIIQALNVCLEIPQRPFTEQLLQSIDSLVTDRVGNSVVLRCLNGLCSSKARNEMLRGLLTRAKDFVNTEHGSAVIRCIIENEDLDDGMRGMFVSSLGENVLKYSCQKYASEAIVASLRCFPLGRDLLIENLLKEKRQDSEAPTFCQVASDKFGHKVVLEMIQVAEPRESAALQSKIRHCMPEILATSNYGRVILEKLDCPPLTRLKESAKSELPTQDLILHAVEMSIDPVGFKYLKKKLRTMTPEELGRFCDRVLPVAQQLTTDKIGHKLVKALLDIGIPKVLQAFKEMLIVNALEVSLDQFGSRVLQKALACFGAEDKVKIVEQLEPKVVEYCQDKHGYAVIQACLDSLDETRVQSLLRKITEELSELAKHQYGGLVIQHILQHCSEEQKRQLLQNVQYHPGDIGDLACHRYGNKVIRSAIKYCSGKDAESLYKVLYSNLVSLTQAEYGNKVVKALIKKSLSQELIRDIVDQLSSHTLDLAKDSYGHKVILCILEKCQGSCNLSSMMEEIHSKTEVLAQDSHGVQVIKAVLTHGSEEDQVKFAAVVRENLVAFSQHSCANEVVQKCLEHSSHTERAKLIRAACHRNNENEPKTHFLMSDNRYGQDVLFKMMNVARNEQIVMIVNEIKRQLPNLRQTMARTRFLFKLDEFCVKNGSVRDENGN